MGKDPPANAGDTGSIPGLGGSTCATGQLAQCDTTAEVESPGVHAPPEKPPQQVAAPARCNSRKPHTAAKMQHSQQKIKIRQKTNGGTKKTPHFRRMLLHRHGLYY